MIENRKPLVSVLVPLYNQEKYFGTCMRSICKQTYNNLEIVIVNDGSTDCSPLMAHDWAARDVRVKIIDKQNEGLAFARRDGLLAATGEYVTFLDSDDTLPKRAIEAMVNCAQNTGVDLVQGSFDKNLGFLKRKKADKRYSFPFNQVISQPELFEKYYVGFFSNRIFPIQVCMKLYRKSVLDKAYKDTELFSSDILFMGEDLHFNMKLFPYLNSMYRIDKPVYNYRYGGGTFGFNKNFPQLFILSDKRLRLLDEYNYAEGYKPLYDEYVACLYYHASQLIHYKKTKKEDVIDFFRHEMEVRELIPRLVDYYTINGIRDKAVESLCSHDFDAMYDYAYDNANRLFRSIKYMLFKFVMKTFSLFS